LYNFSSVADAAIDDLLKPKVEEPPVELSKEPDVTEVLEEPNAEVNADVYKIYNDMILNTLLQFFSSLNAYLGVSQ
jgi:hypothetical protein